MRIDESQWSHSLIAAGLLLAGAALAVAQGVLLCLPGQALVDLEARGAAVPIVVADVPIAADALIALSVNRVLALCVAVIAAGQQRTPVNDQCGAQHKLQTGVTQAIGTSSVPALYKAVGAAEEQS